MKPNGTGYAYKFERKSSGHSETGDGAHVSEGKEKNS